MLYRSIMIKLLFLLLASVLLIVACEPGDEKADGVEHILPTDPLTPNAVEPFPVTAYQFSRFGLTLEGKKIALTGSLIRTPYGYRLSMLPTDKEVHANGTNKNYVITVPIHVDSAYFNDASLSSDLEKCDESKSVLLIGRVGFLKKGKRLGIVEIERITLPVETRKPVSDRYCFVSPSYAPDITEIHAVQRLLVQLGYIMDGKIKPTNKEMQKAIAAFQRDYHVPITGAINGQLILDLTHALGRRLINTK